MSAGNDRGPEDDASRDAPEGPADASGAGAPVSHEDLHPIKLLQGYLWHPKETPVDLAEYVPQRLDPDVHVLWDELPRAPFTFFDDGTLAATQAIYQFTVMTWAEDEETAGRLTPWLAEVLQRALETTPEGVGWQIMEDLRPLD